MKISKERWDGHVAELASFREERNAFRDENARLLKENAEKDVTSKALADALGSMRDAAGHIEACGNGGEDPENCSPLCNKVDAALRRAGVLP
jgi:hypothetical protein